MKNIAVMIGSLRKDSVNRMVFNNYAEMAKDKFKFTEINFRDWPHYNQDIEPFPAAVTEAADVIRGSDGLLIFSPEYNYSIPGVLKNAIDWLSRVEKQPFNHKHAAIIGASPGSIGTARMQYHLRQVAVFLNVYIMNKPEVMIGAAYDKVKDNKIVDEKTTEFLKHHIEEYLAFLDA